MTVAELIEKLKKFPPDAMVKNADYEDAFPIEPYCYEDDPTVWI